MATNQNYIILEGPGKFELMTALFVPRTPVTFTVETKSGSKELLKACLSGIDQENGDGKQWLIRGFFSHVNYPDQSINFSGYYDSTRRRGWMAFPEGKTNPAIDILEGRRIRVLNTK